MTERPTDDSGPTAVGEHHTALLSLHASGAGDGSWRDPGLIPGFRPVATGPALRTLAAASPEEVPVSARMGVLGELARANFPDWETDEDAYRALAASVAGLRQGVAADQVLEDLKLATTEKVPFHTLQSGQALPHEEAAFVGEDICTVRTVRTGGLTATWIFSEFETDAPFEKVADWVDPRNWPERGPMLFRAMDLVGVDQPVGLGPPGDVHWHAIFREEVNLVLPVQTLLHCDFWREGGHAAGMTYDLALSLDDKIDVDRGFLLVNDVGPVRRVKALKIVGFKEDIWDRVATLVRPFWTDWVRAAVQGGQSSTPKSGPSRPQGEGIWDDDDGDHGERHGDGQRTDWARSAEQWVDLMGDSARTYLTLVDEMGTRALAPDATARDLVQDQRSLFSQLAKDWAQLWFYGMDAMEQVAREGMDAGLAPPDPKGTGTAKPAGATFAGGTSATSAGGSQPAQDPEGTEGTIVPVAGLTDQDAPTVSDLVSIEAGGARIPAATITTAVESLGGAARGVRLRVPAGSLSPGLYVGQVTARPGAGAVPVQLYISRSAQV